MVPPNAITFLLAGKYLGIKDKGKISTDMAEIDRLHQRQMRNADRAVAGEQAAQVRVTEAQRVQSAARVRLTNAESDVVMATQRRVATETMALQMKVNLAGRSALAQQVRMAKTEEAEKIAAARRYERAAIAADDRVTINAQRASAARIRAHAEEARLAKVADDRAAANRKARVAHTVNRATGVGMGIGVGAGYLADRAIRMSVSQDTLMHRLQANTGISTAQRKDIASWVLRDSAKTGANEVDLVNAMRHALSSGKSVGVAKRLIDVAIKSALPTGGSVEGTTVSLLSTLNTYGFKPQQATKVMDILHRGSALGDMTLPQLSKVFPQLGVISSQFGGGTKGLIDTVSGLSALTRTHMPLRDAITQMKDLAIHIATPGKQGRTEIAQLYNDTQGRVDLRSDFSAEGLRSKGLTGVLGDIRAAHLTPAQIYKLVPNLRGYVGALSLTGNQRGDALSIRNQLQHSGGATETAWKQYQGTAQANMAKFNQNLRVIGITVGNALLPQFNELMKTMTPLLMRFTDWSGKNPQLIATLLKVGLGIGAVSLATRGAIAVFGPLMSLFRGVGFVARGLVTGLGGLFTAMRWLAGAGARLVMGGIRIMIVGFQMLRVAIMANPFAFLIGTLILVGIGLVALYKNWKPFRDLVNGAGLAIKGFADGTIKWMMPALTSIVKYGKIVVDWMAANWKLLIVIMGGPLIWVTAAVIKWGPDLLRLIQGIINTTLKWVGDNFSKLLGLVQATLNTTLKWLGGLGPQFASAASGWITGARNGIVSNSHRIAEGLTTAISHAINGAKGAIGKKMDELGGWIADKLNNIPGIKWLTGGGGPSNSSNPTISGTTFAPAGAGPGGRFGNFGAASANYASANDLAMFKSLGIPSSGTIMDTDYPSSPQNVRMPGGKNNTYTLVKQYMDKANVGGVEIWKTINNGLIAFLHLSKLSNTKTATGGQVVGVSGHPLGKAWNNNPDFYHLCVVTDAQGRADMQWLTNDQMVALTKKGKSVQSGQGGPVAVGKYTGPITLDKHGNYAPAKTGTTVASTPAPHTQGKSGYQGPIKVDKSGNYIMDPGTGENLTVYQKHPEWFTPVTVGGRTFLEHNANYYGAKPQARGNPVEWYQSHHYTPYLTSHGGIGWRTPAAQAAYLKKQAKGPPNPAGYVGSNKGSRPVAVTGIPRTYTGLTPDRVADILSAARHFGVDPRELIKLSLQESGGFNPSALAVGPYAAMGFGFSDPSNPTHFGPPAPQYARNGAKNYAGPHGQIWGSASYLAMLHKKYPGKSLDWLYAHVYNPGGALRPDVAGLNLGVTTAGDRMNTAHHRAGTGNGGIGTGSNDPMQRLGQVIKNLAADLKTVDTRLKGPQGWLTISQGHPWNLPKAAQDQVHNLLARQQSDKAQSAMARAMEKFLNGGNWDQLQKDLAWIRWNQDKQTKLAQYRAAHFGRSPGAAGKIRPVRIVGHVDPATYAPTAKAAPKPAPKPVAKHPAAKHPAGHPAAKHPAGHPAKHPAGHPTTHPAGHPGKPAPGAGHGHQPAHQTIQVHSPHAREQLTAMQSVVKEIQGLRNDLTKKLGGVSTSKPAKPIDPRRVGIQKATHPA